MPDSATQHPTPPRASSGSVDMQTLLITAAASAAAAYTCSKIWAPGTLAAAAFTPVLVAIIKEALAKSTEAVTRVVPVRGVVRSARAQGTEPDFDDDRGEPPAGPYDDDPGYPDERVAQAGEISYHGSKGSGRGWRVAIVTGLLGFLVAAVVFTVPELVAGGSAAGGERGTTIFGGKARDRSKPVVTPTTTAPATTVTTPPQETVTEPAPTETVPAPQTTEPPVQTTPVVPPTPEPAPPAEEPLVEPPPG